MLFRSARDEDTRRLRSFERELTQERENRAADTQRLQSLERELTQERQARDEDTRRLQSFEQEPKHERIDESFSVPLYQVLLLVAALIPPIVLGYRRATGPVAQERQARAADTQRLQSLERELNQERQARTELEQQFNQERETRTGLEQQLNQERETGDEELYDWQQQLDQERQARIAAEDSLRREQAQGTSRCFMPLAPMSLAPSLD